MRITSSASNHKPNIRYGLGKPPFSASGSDRSETYPGRRHRIPSIEKRTIFPEPTLATPKSVRLHEMAKAAFLASSRGHEDGPKLWADFHLERKSK